MVRSQLSAQKWNEGVKPKNNYEGGGARKLERRWVDNKKTASNYRELVLTSLQILCDGETTGPKLEGGGGYYSLRYCVTSWKVSVVERGAYGTTNIV